MALKQTATAVALCLVLLAGSARAELFWDIQTVETGTLGTGSDTSLALDSSDYPHISYVDADFHATYATWDGDTWSTEPVDVFSTPSGTGSSIVLNAEGLPRISYTATGGQLKYAYSTGSSWWPTQVDPDIGATGYTSLALGPTGSPGISYWHYIDADSSELMYATLGESGWSTEGVAAGVSPAQVSLAIDSTGHPQMSYWSSDKTLAYASWTGSTWAATTVDSTPSSGLYSSLVLDENGRPRIAYSGLLLHELKYAAWNGTSWSIQTVETTDIVTRDVSLALDGNGYPHISYQDATNSDLKYAAWDGTSWSTVSVDTDGSVGWYTSLALDSSGYPHISYQDATNNALKYAVGTPEPGVACLALLSACMGAWVRKRRGLKPTDRKAA